MSQRPVLRIDTSGRLAPRSLREGQLHPNSQKLPIPFLACEPHKFSPGQHPPQVLTEPWQQQSTDSLACSNTFTPLEPPPERLPSRDPLGSSTEFDNKLEGRLFLHVYATEIRITEVEAKDGYKSMKTIIRPASAASTSSSVISRPVQASVSPIVNFSRPSTPVSISKPSRTMGHGVLPSPIRTASWRLLPSLGLPRKHGRGSRSSQFEEEVDYLQAKLEKEALGGASTIRIAMEVEQSIHIERRPRQRHRRALQTQQRWTSGAGR